MIPVPEHAQALEVGALDVDLLGGKRAALGLHVVARELASEFLFDCVLDRQAMAIPPRNVGCVHAFELARLDDHVLENLVECMPHVNLPIGIGRAVVQHKLRRARACHAQPLVQALVVPFLDPAGLAFGQVAPHRKGRVRQVERRAIVGFDDRFKGRRGFIGHGGAGWQSTHAHRGNPG